MYKTVYGLRTVLAHGEMPGLLKIIKLRRIVLLIFGIEDKFWRQYASRYRKPDIDTILITYLSRPELANTYRVN